MSVGIKKQTGTHFSVGDKRASGSARERLRMPAAASVRRSILAILAALPILVLSGDQALAQTGTAPAKDQAETDVVESLIRDAVGLLRQEIIGRSADRVGLLDEHRWRSATDPRRWVILVHGFASGIDSLQPLMDQLEQQGLRCRRFAYPNDGSVADAANILSRELAVTAQRYPDRKLTIISHSMGGLVSRFALEYPGMATGNVDQLIMVSPPNQGSDLAALPVGAEPERLVQLIENQAIGKIFAAAIQGAVGRAQTDLLPDSAFLEKLNQLPRNPHVRYSIFAGTDAPVQGPGAAAVQELNRLARQIPDERPALQAIMNQIALAANSEALQAGRGDGVVSVQSAKLADVTDFQTLPYGHNVLTQGLNTPAGEKLLREIVSRIVQ